MFKYLKKYFLFNLKKYFSPRVRLKYYRDKFYKLEKSMNLWKVKYYSLKSKLKYYRNKSYKLEKSRNVWKVKYYKLEKKESNIDLK